LRKPVTLIGGQFKSHHFGTEPYLHDAVALTREEAPLALHLGAANGDDESFGTRLCALLAAAGAVDVVWPKLAARRGAATAARKALERVHFVFIGGGDVEAGMNVLQRAQLVADIREAAARGVVFAGMSAGAIMLGERWIRWPRADAGDDEAETYECLALAPCALDCHGEADGWTEARSFAAVRARELKRKAKVYGIPSGGALVAHSGGRMHALGEPVPVFAALPQRAATIERRLRAKKT
jgi:peptidase E